MTTGQQDVLSILKKYGPLPDHATAEILHHESPNRQSSSSVRSRRVELQRGGFVEKVGSIKTASGRKAGLFGAV